MPRRPEVSVDLRSVDGAFDPLVTGPAADFSVAMQALVTSVNSTTVRETIMRESGFPLADDLPAFLMLNQLIYRTTARPSDMADAIGTGRSNVSKIVKRLEIAGLVGRMPDPEDGRHSVIGLTEAGREVARRILAVAHGSYDFALRKWTDSEFEQLTTLLVRFVADLDEGLDHGIELTSGVRLPKPQRTFIEARP